jgi:hypothetical protein
LLEYFDAEARLLHHPADTPNLSFYSV